MEKGTGRKGRYYCNIDVYMCTWICTGGTVFKQGRTDRFDGTERGSLDLAHLGRPLYRYSIARCKGSSLISCSGMTVSSRGRRCILHACRQASRLEEFGSCVCIMLARLIDSVGLLLDFCSTFARLARSDLFSLLPNEQTLVVS